MVEFLKLQGEYPDDTDLICELDLKGHEVIEGDRVAVFKLGWKSIKDLLAFEWVPKYTETNVVQVKFKEQSLRSDTYDLYQFCYVSGNNTIHSVSQPFQFISESKDEKELMGEIDIQKLPEQNCCNCSIEMSQLKQKVDDFERVLSKQTQQIQELRQLISKQYVELDELAPLPPLPIFL